VSVRAASNMRPPPARIIALHCIESATLPVVVGGVVSWHWVRVVVVNIVTSVSILQVHKQRTHTHTHTHTKQHIPTPRCHGITVPVTLIPIISAFSPSFLLFLVRVDKNMGAWLSLQMLECESSLVKCTMHSAFDKCIQRCIFHSFRFYICTDSE